jgi:hypothetical protein
VSYAIESIHESLLPRNLLDIRPVVVVDGRTNRSKHGFYKAACQMKAHTACSVRGQKTYSSASEFKSYTPDSPGSPWAIGSSAGGHMAIEPQLGTLDDFDHFVAVAERLGLEIALDFAVQCSPDHPWVSEQAEWFRHRPDGSIKYAENPPKQYQDIYPINFDSADQKGLVEESRRVVLFWIVHGVKIFRVDNPHTKPVAFWEWLINTVQEKHPEVIFLAEAFVRTVIAEREVGHEAAVIHQARARCHRMPSSVRRNRRGSRGGGIQEANDEAASRISETARAG